VYFGQFFHTIDAKGRVSIPAKWRDGLLGDSRLVLAPYTVRGEHCVELYPFAEWEKLLARFATLPRFGASTSKFEMGFLARSHPCEIDQPGRILVPPPLRQHAGLEKDVVFAGVNTTFRLMERERFEKVMSEHDKEASLDRNHAIYEDVGL
jgi:MraZ protein